MAHLRVTQNDGPHKEAVPHFARFGYAAKGVTYLLIGLLSARAALGDGAPGDTRDTLTFLDKGIIGTVLLAVIAAGLAAYAFYKLYFVLANPEHAQATKRLNALFVGAVNAGLAFEAARLALSSRHSSGSGNQAAHWSAIVMQHRFGVIAVGVAGAGIALYGLSRIVKAFQARLDKKLRLHELTAGTRRFVVGASRIGVAGRGIVFVLVGIFLVRAALHANPGEAKDLGYSLRELQQQPFGSILLGVVAVGLMLYGVYQLVRARYRVFPA